MALALDHAFIMCSRGAPEGDSLVQRGFVEGSRNVHPGQGTANRRFFFENFMLELLWVDNPDDARSEHTRRTRLWERWEGRNRSASPFGILFCSADDDDSPAPFPTWDYRPNYLPPGVAIEIAEGTTLEEPELFCMPSMRRDRPRRPEPTGHAGIGNILGLTIGVRGIGKLSDASRAAQDAGLLRYRESDQPLLEVRCALASDSTIDLRPSLPLLFRGESALRAPP
jgi:hypothetical protein